MNIGLPPFFDFYNSKHGNLLFKQYEMGKISDQEFIRELKLQSAFNPSDQEIINAWNSVLSTIPNEYLSLLLSLKNNYRTFLLSNTNNIHFLEFSILSKGINGFNNLSSYFEQVYYSFKMNMRKPDEEIFTYVIEKEKLIPEETIFIDDTLENIESANKIGLSTHHLQSPQTITDLFS